MVSSEWGDWLPDAFASADPDGIAIWYLGCNGFVLKDGAGTTLFIDPYLGPGDAPRTVRMIPIPFDPTDIRTADALLATHEHTDHVHGPSQAPILESTGAPFIAPSASIRKATEAETWTEEWAVDDDQFTEVAVGDSIVIGAFEITVGPAYDPDAEEPVSYVIDHPHGTIVHAGDSKPSDTFESVGDSFDVDLAIVAFGSVGNLLQYDGSGRSRTTWYCDENDAIEIANSLQASTLLPSHWDMWKGMRADPTALHEHARSWPYPHTLQIAEIGDRLDLTDGAIHPHV